MRNDPELSLTIPFFNEEENVNIVLTQLSEALKRNKIDYEVIAVDNGSHDRTGRIIDRLSAHNKRIRKIKIITNKGYGYGILAGLSQSRGKYIGYLWGDNEVPLNKTIEVYTTLKRDNLDLCKIVRVAREKSVMRSLQSNIYNSLMDFLFGLDSTDINGCPKIMRVETYRKLGIKSKDWFIDAEIMLKLKEQDLTYGEVKIRSLKRKKGQSKVDWKTTVEFFLNIMRYRIGLIR